MLAIACGFEDADDCDALRADPLFKPASGKAPESGGALCSQPTMSRLENAPSRIEVVRMTVALVDIFCRSFPTPPATVTLDIDYTCDPVHGHQQLSLFHAHWLVDEDGGHGLSPDAARRPATGQALARAGTRPTARCRERKRESRRHLPAHWVRGRVLARRASVHAE